MVGTRELTCRLLMRFIKMLNIMLMTLPFAVCWFGYYANNIDTPFQLAGNCAVTALYAAMYLAFARIYDGFWVSHNRISELIYSQCLAASVADAFIYVVILLLTKGYANILPGVLCLATQVICSALWSVGAHNVYFAMFKARQAAAVFEWDSDVDSLIRSYKMEKKYDLKKQIHISEFLESPDVLNGFDLVFLGDLNSEDRNLVLTYCVENDIISYVLPEAGDLMMSGSDRLHLFHLPVMRVVRYNPGPEYLVAKRLFDIVVAGTAAIILSPVILVTAIAIKTGDGGPVFYKQCRLTKDGKTFDVLKFRSMRVDAEANGVARLSSGDNDPRITPVGRIIRKCRVDELPQLFNIIGGSMSIVGPRPERPEIAAQYEETLPEFRLRLQAKAGLTGYAQVYGKYNTTPYNKLKMDLMYIANPGIIEDLKICFATVKILFMSDSTEGVEEGQTTAMSGLERRRSKNPIRITPRAEAEAVTADYSEEEYYAGNVG